jgi:hypothetical protein
MTMCTFAQLGKRNNALELNSGWTVGEPGGTASGGTLVIVFARV